MKWSRRAPARSATARTRAPHRRRESGTSAVEFSIIAPAFILITFAIIQTALYFHARDTAQSAAREGVSYLRLAGSNADPESFTAGAEQVAALYATRVGRLQDVEVIGTIDTDSGRVTMVVIGTTVTPLGGTTEVQQSSTATLEQFRGDLR